MADDKSILEGDRIQLPATATLHQLFEELVESSQDGKPYADREAIRFQKKSLTFREVNEQANQLARSIMRKLNDNGIDSKTFERQIIVIFIPPSERRIIAMMATFKLGAAYLPLDPVLPIKRMTHIIQEAKPVCLVTAQENIALINNADIFGQGLAVMEFEELAQEGRFNGLAKGNLSAQESMSSAADTNPIACVLYTSGSTGVPKGVKLRHNNIINRLAWQWEQLPFVGEEMGIAKTSILFVDSVTETFGCLLKGVPFVIVPKSVTQNLELFIQELEDNKVTRLVLVPTLLRNMLLYLEAMDFSKPLEHLKLVVSSGEALPLDLLREFFQKFPEGHRLANYYGSTETTGDITYDVFHNMADVDSKVVDGKVSIGRPLANCNAYILDQDMQAVPLGEIGEVYVSGMNVSEGYMDAEKMVAYRTNHLIEDVNHKLLYNTGDFGRIVSGRIIYEGRKDSQVKIHGQRVNITEIEKVMQDMNSVDRVVVLTFQPTPNTTSIIGFFTPAPGCDVTEEQVVAVCKEYFPPYMVPHVTRLAAIPLQPSTGKVDRVALRALYAEKRGFATNNPVSDDSLDDLAQSVRNIIACEIGVPDHVVDLNKNFFDMGGNSVNAMTALVKLKQKGHAIEITSFLRAVDIKEIIDTIRKKEPAKTDPTFDERYTILPLNQVPNNEDSMRIVADSFALKDDMTVALGVDSETFYQHVKNVWPSVVRDDLSVVVVEKKTNRVVACEYNVDLSGPEPPPFIEPLIAIGDFLGE